MGILMGLTQRRRKLKDNLKKLKDKKVSPEVKEAVENWLETYTDTIESRRTSKKLVLALEDGEFQGKEKALVETILSGEKLMSKKSIWIVGGDGWAYDIGYGGLDHVLASGENVNVLVLDTEVYSNTGGQSSKSTPAGAVAKFASSGKKIRKKDLGMMAMSYGYVYVAQVAMGANNAQLLKALKEAEAYDGPSLIIAYSPCINHSLSRGMGQSQMEEKLAVECGYWQLYRYNPSLIDEGKNPFTLDSKEPDWSKFQDFIKGEVRYSSLLQTFPDQAAELFVLTEKHAKIRYNNYKRLAQ